LDQPSFLLQVQVLSWRLLDAWRKDARNNIAQTETIILPRACVF
jgi:hypothetical protein